MTCDHCQASLTRDVNGWWVGADGTSECPVNPDGHEVDGQAR